MTKLTLIRQKLLSLAVAGVAVCFTHGTCSSYDGGFFYETVDYIDEWYEDTVYYYDDYYYYDDCARCGHDGWGSWFDWF
jgi:hypothetical protein